MVQKAGESEATGGRGGTPPERWGAQRKTEVVLRLIRGDDLGEVSREVQVAPHELEEWRSGFARNVCVGLGNWGSEAAVPVLRSALADPDPLVRGACRLGPRILGSSSAADVLSAALETEADLFVRAELEAALARREFSSK